MNESRVDYLVSLFVDDRLSEEESGELARLIEDQPELLEELQAQLEAADMVSQAENDLRSPSRFLENLQRRLDEPIMPNPSEDKPVLPVELVNARDVLWGTGKEPGKGEAQQHQGGCCHQPGLAGNRSRLSFGLDRLNR